jgi:hypothetical protein
MQTALSLVYKVFNQVADPANQVKRFGMLGLIGTIRILIGDMLPSIPKGE